MMSNFDLVNYFVDGNICGVSNIKMYNGSMHFVDDILYSYDTAIGQYNKKDGTFIVNTTKYSITTSKHRSYLISALEARKIAYNEVNKVKIGTTNLIANQ